eukprot:TRINITY_DN1477_c0_g1_i1.p3 TRINITY_DN1477_c0_g1~~TRINITY_DN1477_c0_g1_i1.p3  ORF type:complete len:103 (-),score=13.23 TRINITY_DN1477_c0_g1_i1:609-917(-)
MLSILKECEPRLHFLLRLSTIFDFSQKAWGAKVPVRSGEARSASLGKVFLRLDLVNHLFEPDSTLIKDKPVSRSVSFCNVQKDVTQPFPAASINPRRYVNGP